MIIRKNSRCNRSQRGAETQAIVMSVYRPLKQCGHSPLDTMPQAIKAYLTTGHLPHYRPSPRQPAKVLQKFLFIHV